METKLFPEQSLAPVRTHFTLREIKYEKCWKELEALKTDVNDETEDILAKNICRNESEV